MYVYICNIYIYIYIYIYIINLVIKNLVSNLKIIKTKKTKVYT